MTQFGIFIPDGPRMHIEGLNAFVDGLRRFRIPYQVSPLLSGYQPCDVMVTFGVAKKRTPRGRAILQLAQDHNVYNSGRRWQVGKHLVIERGFIHREKYFMVGWDGLNGRARYFNDHSPHDRWDKLRVPVAPWRKTGKHIVLCGQVPWDASVQHTDHVAWCRQTAIELGKYSDRPIRFRPHPLQPDAIDMTGIPVVTSTGSSLQEDMQDAWAVVTFNSNASVEATIAGIPAFVGDEGAMGHAVLNRDLSKIESPVKVARENWFNSLAYTQWTLEEIAGGLPIEHLWIKRLNLLRWGEYKLATLTPRWARVACSPRVLSH